MKFYACDSRGKSQVAILKKNGWGRLVVANVLKPYEGEYWAMDNGAFKCWIDKTEWDGDAFLRRIDNQYKNGVPDFIVVPDLPTKALESLDHSMKWKDRLPKDWKKYLAVQDGMTLEDIEPLMDCFDGLFLGGSDYFKTTGIYWSGLAHKYGKKFHYARCSTKKKIEHARRIKTDSIDSAFPFWITERRKVVEMALVSELPPLLWDRETGATTPNKQLVKAQGDFAWSELRERIDGTLIEPFFGDKSLDKRMEEDEN